MSHHQSKSVKPSQIIPIKTWITSYLQIVQMFSITESQCNGTKTKLIYVQYTNNLQMNEKFKTFILHDEFCKLMNRIVASIHYICWHWQCKKMIIIDYTILILIGQYTANN